MQDYAIKEHDLGKILRENIFQEQRGREIFQDEVTFGDTSKDIQDDQEIFQGI